MNPSVVREARRLFEAVKRNSRRFRGAETVIAPPFVYLPLFRPTSHLKLGAQDVSFADEGAWTGEISAKMLRDLRVSYVLVGHSERRELGETNDSVHQKLAAALSKGLRTVLCVGEKERSREAFPALVREEIRSALKGVPRRFAARTLVTYEPVWAISSHSGGRADTPQNFFEMSIFIRRLVLDLWGKSAALKLPILYGGSVNSKNAAGFLGVKSSGGLLVGQASLNPGEFSKILEAASR